PGGGKRFMQSFGEGLPGYDPNDAFSAIKDVGSGLYHIFSHPIDSTNLLYHGTVDPMELTNQKAMARLPQAGVANKLTGAIEYAESGVPFLGPALAHAGEQNESGNWAGGFGTTAAAALPFLVGPAAEGTSSLASSVTSRLSRPKINIEQAVGRRMTP